MPRSPRLPSRLAIKPRISGGYRRRHPVWTGRPAGWDGGTRASAPRPAAGGGCVAVVALLDAAAVAAAAIIMGVLIGVPAGDVGGAAPPVTASPAAAWRGHRVPVRRPRHYRRVLHVEAVGEGGVRGVWARRAPLLPVAIGWWGGVAAGRHVGAGGQSLWRRAPTRRPCSVSRGQPQAPTAAAAGGRGGRGVWAACLRWAAAAAAGRGVALPSPAQRYSHEARREEALTAVGGGDYGERQPR